MARHLLRFLGVAMLSLATAALGFAIFAPGASAAQLSGAITKVTVTPPKPAANGNVRVDVNWCVPNGSHAGDTFTLTLPPQLQPLTGGFALLDPATGQPVANAVVTNRVVTFTLTDYVQTHLDVCGSAFFQEQVEPGRVTVGAPTPLVFDANGTIFTPTITPTPPTPCTGNCPTSPQLPTQPWKVGAWVDPVDGAPQHPKDALRWAMFTQPAPAGGFSTVRFTDTAGAGQSFDCATVTLTLGTVSSDPRWVATGPYPGRPQITCSPTALSVLAGPVAAGASLRMTVEANITDGRLTTFTDSGQVVLDGVSHGVTAPPVVRTEAGGIGSGTPRPSGSSAPTSASAPATSPASSGMDVATSTSAVAVLGFEATTAAKATPSLAETGVASAALVLFGVTALGLGGVLLLLSSRRRQH